MKSPLFNAVKIRRPRTNVFDLSHEKKLSMNMGELIPVYLQEVVPGDKFRVSTEHMIRLAPMVAPVMHRVNAYVHHFFVPNRLVFSNWENFITGGENGLDASVFPKIRVTESDRDKFAMGGLSDYLGVPVPQSGTVVQGLDVNALPFRAYQLIYNEYYRDQNLQTKVALTKNDTVDGTELSAITTLRKRCWEKDYFTSALSQSQKGGEVLLPMENTVNYISQSHVKATTGADAPDGAISSASGHLQGTGSAPARIENIDTIDSELTINELRRAVKLQEWLEKNARAGSRYIESILSHFGVKSSDARLQRPEYLGGGKAPVMISEVLATYGTDATIPVGTMAGHGLSIGKSNSFSKYFEEHGFIISILSVLPVTNYSQGLPRLFSKFDKFDYYWPEFAHLGEQEIKNREIYASYDSGTFDEATTWGYQSRFAEYKFQPSSIHGEFRDSSLRHWHMGRLFSSGPALNASFVESDPTHDIFAVTDANYDKLYVQLYNDVRAIRPMPVFGTPSF